MCLLQFETFIFLFFSLSFVFWTHSFGSWCPHVVSHKNITEEKKTQNNHNSQAKRQHQKKKSESKEIRVDFVCQFQKFQNKKKKKIPILVLVHDVKKYHLKKAMTNIKTIKLKPAKKKNDNNNIIFYTLLCRSAKIPPTGTLMLLRLNFAAISNS